MTIPALTRWAPPPLLKRLGVKPLHLGVIGALAAVRQLSASDADWPSYLGNEERSHYSTLAQINASNVHELVPAWTYRAGEIGSNQRAEMQCNPLIVRGVIYATL